MAKKHNIFLSMLQGIKKNTAEGSEYEYAVMYGFFSIILIFGKQIFSFIFSNNLLLTSQLYHIVVILISAILLIIFAAIHVKKIGEDNKFSKNFIKYYPYVVTVLGNMIILMYSDYYNRGISFFVFMSILVWVQIYKTPKRTIVFLFSAFLFTTISYLTNGISETFHNDVIMCIISLLVMFLLSSIIALLYYSHQNIIKNLDFKNKKYELAMNNLKYTHKSLKISKEITTTMYELTQEVLKNENLEDVLQIVLDKAASLIPNSQAGSILIRDEENMIFVAAKGYDLENLKRVDLKFSETYQATLSDLYEPHIIKNLEVFDEIHIGKEKTQKLRTEAATLAKACMTCSFKHNDNFFGSINIDNFDSENAFDENDIYLMKQLAQEIEIIISIHKLYEQAIKPSKYDELTGANTRRYCMKRLKEMILKNKDVYISICTIDINELKKVNDMYGHDIGDKFLCDFVDGVKKSNLKENIFGRVGGDEFLIIFKNTDDNETKFEIEKIREYFSKNLFVVNQEKYEITFGAGVAVYNKDGVEITQLIKLSDERMYQDKFLQKESKKNIFENK